MSSNRPPATNKTTIRIRLDDSALSKDKIPAPTEISELMGRTTPLNAYSGLLSTREWGKMSALFGMTLQNIQSLPSLRGREINFTDKGPQRNQKADVKDFITYAVTNPSALLKTLPTWHWDAATDDESKATTIFSNLLANIVSTPNIIYGFLSTVAEVTTKTSGAALMQPFHYLWKGMTLPDPKDKKTGAKLGFFARAARAIPQIFTQPFKNIQTSWEGIKKNWREFAADTTTPRWKKVLNGIGLGFKTAVQTIGLGVAAIPPISWTLALAGWAAGQTLSYASNALSYVRHIVDGLTTLAVNAPKALSGDPEKAIICKSAAKTVGKSALLLLPTAAIVAAAIFIPGAQVLPAIAPIVGAKILTLLGITSAGAQLAAGAINYKFAEANLKKAQTATAAISSNQQIAKNIAAKPALKAKPIPEKTPLLASTPDSPSRTPAPSPKTSTPVSTPGLPAQQTSMSHYSTFLELHHGENIQEKIRHLRDTFLLKKPSRVTPAISTIIADTSPATTVTPSKDVSPTAHQHLHWNEHQDNAWVEYKQSDTRQYVSEIIAIGNDLNPCWILTQAISDPQLRSTLEPTLKAGIKQLSVDGKPLDKTNLLAFVNDADLAQTLADQYKKTTRQTIHNHYTHIDHEYPADKLLDLAIRQVDSFIKINGAHKTISISNAWDANYVEAIMLYAAAKNYKCKNKSAYTAPVFNTAHIDAFKHLIEQKPYLGHGSTAQNNDTPGSRPITHVHGHPPSEE